MSVTKILKEAGITVVAKPDTKYPNDKKGLNPPTLDQLKEAYPPSGEVNFTPAGDWYGDKYEWKCGDVKVNLMPPYDATTARLSSGRQLGVCGLDMPNSRGMSSHITTDGTKFYHEWRGNSLLVSDKLLSVEFLMEINLAKRQELQTEAKKRSEIIKEPIDAVKAFMKELGYNPPKRNGGLNIQFHKWCDLHIVVADNGGVTVFYKYQYGTYTEKQEIIKLQLADPNFSPKLDNILKNAKNFLDIIAGREKPL